MPHHPGAGGAGPVRLSSQLGQQVATFEPQPNVGGLGIVGDSQTQHQAGGGYYPQHQSLVRLFHHSRQMSDVAED
jgi:hypothetical protein